MYFTERKLFFDGEYLALHVSNVLGFLEKVVEHKTSDGLAECFLKRNCTALRWLITVSSTFQEVDFDGSLLQLFITSCYNHGIKILPNPR